MLPREPRDIKIAFLTAIIGWGVGGLITLIEIIFNPRTGPVLPWGIIVMFVTVIPSMIYVFIKTILED